MGGIAAQDNAPAPHLKYLRETNFLILCWKIVMSGPLELLTRKYQGAGGQDQGWTNPNLQQHHITCPALLWKSSRGLRSGLWFSVFSGDQAIRHWSALNLTSCHWRPVPKAAGEIYRRCHLGWNLLKMFKNFLFRRKPPHRSAPYLTSCHWRPDHKAAGGIYRKCHLGCNFLACSRTFFSTCDLLLDNYESEITKMTCDTSK